MLHKNPYVAHKRICNFKANATRASVCCRTTEGGRMRASDRAMMWQFFNSIFIVFTALLWQAKENTSLFVVLVSAVVVVCWCCLSAWNQRLLLPNMKRISSTFLPPVHASLSLFFVSGFFVRCSEVFPFVCVSERMISSEIIIIEGKARRLTQRKEAEGENRRWGVEGGEWNLCGMIFHYCPAPCTKFQLGRPTTNFLTVRARAGAIKSPSAWSSFPARS